MEIITGKDFRRMVIAGSNLLQKNRQMIDDLNVFPVPDGDTGSNMSMTLASVAKTVKTCESDSISDMAKAASNGALRGARGNSGVITSQIFRGMYESLKEKETATCADFADAVDKAREFAYKAVMKPKEGTILTIIRTLAEEAQAHKNKVKDIEELLDIIVKKANEVLLETPEMLPQLKEAGVVDSGGTGLCKIFEGLLIGIKETEEESVEEAHEESSNKDAFQNFKTEDIVFQYCTEFLINKDNYTTAKKEKLHDFLRNIGDSLVFVEDEEIIKVHVHSNHPGQVLEEALKLGSFITVKIENMKQQHSSLVEGKPEEKAPAKVEAKKDEPKKDLGFIAVSSGDGMSDILTNLNVDKIIGGGQTMNPSTDDFMEAIDAINADNIIIFPNNKNIIMAAEQARDLAEDKNVIVVKTKTVPESISAMVNYVEGTPVDDVVSDMEDAVSNVRTAEITYAVRDTKSNGREIKKNDIIGIMDGEIKVIGKKVVEVARGVVDELSKGKPDIISIYKGQEASDNETNVLQNYIEETYPKLDVEVEQGGQPLYYYIISAE
ncbi:MAG: DAK2 domain-containing protein [Clostridia bacterium]|nr:DAK2 domain-containing protein [Clostridia bacterium]